MTEDSKRGAFGPYGLMCNGLVWVYDSHGTHLFGDVDVPASGARYLIGQNIAMTLIEGDGELAHWRRLEDMGLAYVKIEVGLTDEGEKIATMLAKERTP